MVETIWNRGNKRKVVERTKNAMRGASSAVHSMDGNTVNLQIIT